MNFTQDQVKSFRKWKVNELGWRINGGLYGEPPEKPEGYDLWRFGPSLTTLETAEPIPCKGGELVDNSWRHFNEQ